MSKMLEADWLDEILSSVKQGSWTDGKLDEL